jgi:hypothetical protein
MVERRDYLPVCNDQGTPLPDFQAMFCVRCVQPECSRSRAGGLFETRIATWEERLFKNPPRMSKDDPLYSAISAKRFIELDVARIAEADGRSAWVDPRGLEEPEEPAPKPRPVKRPTPVARVEETLPAAARPEARRTPLNTPFIQGALLIDPGSPVPTAKKPVDRWGALPSAPVAPSDDDTPRVKAGATIKFK